MTTAPGLTVGARALAEFACRDGDLEPGPAGPSAEQGQAAHRRVQDASEREVEVALSRTREVRGRPIALVGRLDLLDRERGIVGEIKTTVVPVERVPASRRAVHLAQAKLYAWIWLGQGGDVAVDIVDVRLEVIYVNIRDDAARAPAIERCTVDRDELEAFASRALECWARWHEHLESRRAALVESAAALAFPFARFRSGQRTLAAAVYRCLRDGDDLFVDAPTGTGKTASVLYPAIKALGERRLDQLQWLTAKNSGRLAVFETLARLRDAGLDIGAVVVRARRASCFCERGILERDALGRCPFAVGFHDRVPVARDAALAAGLLDAAAIDRIAQCHRVCPQALTMQVVPWLPIVVCDYNFVFDPLVSLSALNERAGRHALLIDEAHNLPSRGRAMHSASLSRLDCLDARTACIASHPALGRALHALAGALLGLAPPGPAPSGAARGRATSPAHAPLVSADAPSGIAAAVAGVLDAVAEARASDPPGEPSPSLPDVELSSSIVRVRSIIDGWTEAHRRLVETRIVGRRREVCLKLLCLDAADVLRRRHAGYRASVLISATLQPTGFFRESAGYAESARALVLGSPFDEARACRRVIDWIPVRHAARESSLQALVELLAGTFDARAGHYLAFLPSYEYLERVRSAFERSRPEIETWTQVPGSGEAERARVLARLDASGATFGFAILGGVFGEGVDYVGDRLFGAIVVGTGLPGIGAETRLEIEHHRARGRDGFDFACRYPGFARTMQSAGRVIRSEADRGVILLVDERFGEPFYRHLLADVWRAPAVRDMTGLRRELDAFWGDRDREGA